MATAHRLLGTIVFSAACLLNPVTARAQAGNPDPATAKLAQLGNRCETEFKCPRVWVTSVDGVELRGIVRSVSSAGLVFDADGTRQTLPWAEVRRVERGENIANGVLIGAGLGGLLGYQITGPGCIDDNECAVGSFPLLTGAVFGVIFGALDAVNKGRKTVYSASTTTATLRIAPVVSRHRLGFQVSLRDWHWHGPGR